MSVRRSAGAARTLSASLLLVGLALLVGGYDDARAAALSSAAALPSSAALTINLSPQSAQPLISVSVPGLSASEPPLINVSGPNLSTLETPAVSVSIPSVSVSAPGVTVSVPSVSVAVPSVGVSETGITTPVASVPTTPTPPVTTAPSAPPVSDAPPVGGGVSSTSSVLPASSASSSDSSTVAPAHSSSTTPQQGAPVIETTSAGATSKQPRPSTRHHTVTPRGRALGGLPVAAAPLPAPRTSSPRSTGGAHLKHAVRTGGSHNPLDVIGGRIPLPIPVPNWSKPIIVLLLLLALWLGVRARLAAVRARRLEGQRVSLLRDMDVMQMALVPQVPASLGGLTVSVAYRPADGPAAGGDFYDVFVPAPGKVAIILGDVAGHGHQALKQAALTRYTLRAYLQAGLAPRAALALAGRVSADPAVEHFATVAVATYDTRAGILTYALAGHPPPILGGFHAPEHLLACSSPPLGWTVPTGRRQTVLSLPAGATVCFFSDGLIEARCGEDLLGTEQLTEILTALGPQPEAAELIARVSSTATASPTTWPPASSHERWRPTPPLTPT